MVSIFLRPDVKYASALGISLISSSLVLLSAGTFYAFSLYGPQLEKRLGYSNSQTAIVASSSNLGVYLTGPLWGLLVDKVNPRWLFLSAAILLAAGYSLASLAYLGQFGPTIPYLYMCLFYFIVGVGSGGAYHSGLATNLRNWPPNFRGLAIGIPVAVFGLCGFICAAVGRAFFSYLPVQDLPEEPTVFDVSGLGAVNLLRTIGALDVPSFLMFLGIQGLVVNFLAAFILKDVRHLRPGNILIEPPESDCSPIFTTEPEEEDEEEDEETVVNPRSNRSNSPVMVEEADEDDEEVPFLHNASTFRRGWTFPTIDVPKAEEEELDVDCFTQVDAYLLVVVMFAVTGTGLMVVNNIGKVILSLFPPHTPTTDPDLQSTQSLHVTILSVAGFIARLLAGGLSDHLSSSQSCFVSRAAWAPIPSVIMLIGSFMATRVEAVHDLIPVTVVIGLAYGTVWTLVPVLVNEFFGTKRFGFHWYVLVYIPVHVI
ncbi:hypothetical protein HDU97_003227 [Phlyctochytrium planicorne]|nr:hypothetical protein HDU97_003227 [Phlyctochytrium planicorne]